MNDWWAAISTENAEKIRKRAKEIKSMRRVIYHDFRKQPIPPVPKPPSGWILALIGVLALVLIMLAQIARADVPPSCWGLWVNGNVSSYHFKLRGDCERMRLAVIANVCEHIPDVPGMHRADCYEQGPPKVRCVPVEDPSCESR